MGTGQSEQRDAGSAVEHRRARSSTARLVVQCVTEDVSAGDLLSASASARSAAAVTRTANAHGVVGWLAHALLATGQAAAPFWADAVSAWRGAVARHQRAVSDLLLAREALIDAGVPHLVVKGPALAALHGDPRLRSYVDLDVLVEPALFPAAVSALARAGCDVIDRNWPLLLREQFAELRLRSPAGGLIDLHWSLLPERRSRETFGVSTERLMRRARERRIGQEPMDTLDEIDTFLHVVLHGCLSGGHRLVWLVDLLAALRQVPDDGALLARAEEWRAGAAMRVMLTRAWRILLTDQEVLRRRCVGLADAADSDAGWRRIVDVTQWLAPAERVLHAGSLARLVARSAAGDGPASRYALARRTASWLKNGMPLEPPSARRLNNSEDPTSALHYVGGARERRAYFEFVVSQARA